MHANSSTSPNGFTATNRIGSARWTQDIERRFDPKYNELLRNGEAIRWLALDTQGRTRSDASRRSITRNWLPLQMDSRRVAAVSSNRSTTSR